MFLVTWRPGFPSTIEKLTVARSEWYSLSISESLEDTNVEKALYGAQRNSSIASVPCSHWSPTFIVSVSIFCKQSLTHWYANQSEEIINGVQPRKYSQATLASSPGPSLRVGRGLGTRLRLPILVMRSDAYLPTVLECPSRNLALRPGCPGLPDLVAMSRNTVRLHKWGCGSSINLVYQSFGPYISIFSGRGGWNLGAGAKIVGVAAQKRAWSEFRKPSSNV